jgi:hypothetical protein
MRIELLDFKVKSQTPNSMLREFLSRAYARGVALKANTH